MNIGVCPHYSTELKYEQQNLGQTNHLQAKKLEKLQGGIQWDNHGKTNENCIQQTDLLFEVVKSLQGQVIFFV